MTLLVAQSGGVIPRIRDNIVRHFVTLFPGFDIIIVRIGDILSRIGGILPRISEIVARNGGIVPRKGGILP